MMRPVLICGAAAATLLGAAALAQPVTIDLPFGEVPAELADPGAQVVVGNCSACHSLDYVTTQPRGKGAAFWRDSVTKMINVYQAPIAPEEAEAVARVLAERFG
jgi:mono/diheme cytochrome c family protein